MSKKNELRELLNRQIKESLSWREETADWFWDYPDIKELLDNVIEEYREWISSVE